MSYTNRPTNRPTDRPTDQPCKRPTDQRTDIARLPILPMSCVQPTDRPTNLPTMQTTDGPTDRHSTLTNSPDELYPCFNEGNQNHDQRHRQEDIQRHIYLLQPQKIGDVHVQA